jgi:hypothetical protein
MHLGSGGSSAQQPDRLARQSTRRAVALLLAPTERGGHELARAHQTDENRGASRARPRPCGCYFFIYSGGAPAMRSGIISLLQRGDIAESNDGTWTHEATSAVAERGQIPRPPSTGPRQSAQCARAPRLGCIESPPNARRGVGSSEVTLTRARSPRRRSTISTATPAPRGSHSPTRRAMADHPRRTPRVYPSSSINRFPARSFVTNCGSSGYRRSCLDRRVNRRDSATRELADDERQSTGRSDGK